MMNVLGGYGAIASCVKRTPRGKWMYLILRNDMRGGRGEEK